LAVGIRYFIKSKLASTATNIFLLKSMLFGNMVYSGIPENPWGSSFVRPIFVGLLHALPLAVLLLKQVEAISTILFSYYK